MIESGIWAVVILYLLVRLEVNYRRWLDHRKPLNEEQYAALSKRIDDMQNQMNNLSLRKEFE